MRVKSIQLTDFRRFSSVTISSLPYSAALVLLVGPNGSGKSSVFDGFLWWHRRATRMNTINDDVYYNKSPGTATVQVDLHDTSRPDRSSLYVRTAYRFEPDFQAQDIRQQPDPVENPRFYRLIDQDVAVAGNYQRLLDDSLGTLLSADSRTKTGQDIYDDLVGDLADSMNRVFPDLTLSNIVNPNVQTPNSRAFFFAKGGSEFFHYKNLSGGEKAAFDLLLDVHLKKRFFPDAIYCIDEIDTHLHTQTQGRILKELARVMPIDSQLWVTTHSLGVVRAAQEIEHDVPGSVAVIDFTEADLDSPCELQPVSVDQVSWEKLLSITLDDLTSSITPERVVVCEGSAVGNRRKRFDASIYSLIFGNTEPHIVFVPGGSKNELYGSGEILRGILDELLPEAVVFTLRDKDDLHPEEIANLSKSTLVLSHRNLESYLLSDEIIGKFLHTIGHQNKLQDVLLLKADAITKSVSRGNGPDDLKSAAGEFYVEMTRTLRLTGHGDNVDSFLRYSLAPEITPETNTYSQMHSDIVDKM